MLKEWCLGVLGTSSYTFNKGEGLQRPSQWSLKFTGLTILATEPDRISFTSGL